jgi:hypothetical protein
VTSRVQIQVKKLEEDKVIICKSFKILERRKLLTKLDVGGGDKKQKKPKINPKKSQKTASVAQW